MKTMFLDEAQKRALNKGLRSCPREQRADIREYIDMLALEWGMIQNVFDGHSMIVGRDADGQLLFRMTRAGARYVEEELLHLNGKEEPA